MEEGFYFDDEGNLIKESLPVVFPVNLFKLGKTVNITHRSTDNFIEKNTGIIWNNKHVKEILSPELPLEETHANEIYDACLKKWGKEPQMVAAIEELAELIVELAKAFNGKREGTKELVDELADAEISIEQQLKNFNLFREVKERKKFKLAKLKQRVGLD